MCFNNIDTIINIFLVFSSNKLQLYTLCAVYKRYLIEDTQYPCTEP